MQYVVLDTDVASRSIKRQLDGPLAAKLTGVAWCITFVTVGELWQWASARGWGGRTRDGLELWLDRLAGAIVAIGNAPTSLFRLLEMLDEGAPHPAAILGIPVGFVGAAESKEALIANSRGVPFIAVRGRAGGSAMTAAAVNGLARAGL